jgi:hypothetical protein
MGEGMKRAFAAAKATRTKTYGVEIFEKKTGRVVETKELTAKGVRDFAFWWARQADHENYEWRQIGAEAPSTDQS